ncbi:MAG: hypothetical protein J6T47_05020, partial [Lachnospiraceae bacterium]|nr:hypothetical protein [Lachnospiraceae bacterium]
MSKKFFEVFNNLSLKEACRDVFSEVWIDQMDLKMDDPQVLIIRMHCDNLILRPDILYCAREIKRQALEDKTDVHFVEHYHLSAQYNLENVSPVMMPLIAKVTDSHASGLNFKHVGGAVKVTFQNIPD